MATLAFDRHGSGPALVLLHSLALDRTLWDGMLPHLADRFTVLTPDLPGHGRSPALAAMSIESMAEAVAELVRAEADPPATVVGLSLGGCVAQALAAGSPELVGGLGLVDTTCWYGETAPADWEARAQRARTDGLESLAGFQLARWFSPGFADTAPGVGEQLLEVFRATDLDAYVATCRAMGAMDLRDRIPAITVPTSIVVGADDPATSPEHAREMHRLIPGSTLRVIPRCSHLSAVERPAEVAAVLDETLFA